MSNLDEIEYYKIVNKILNHPEFQKRKQYAHHGNISVFDHSLAVSKVSYYLAKKLKKDYKIAAVGGLLHDFYYNPWQGVKEKRPFLKKHGFVHAQEAHDNALKYFPEYMNNRVENVILRHMFPVNKIPPKYIEGWIVTIADKYVSCEVLLHPTFFKYLFGIGGK